MYQYNILKKGRKWFEGETVDEKKFKAKIEINSCSDKWQVGEIVSFEAKQEWKSYKEHKSLFLYPVSAEDLATAKTQKEIEKWLGYVENKTNYVYTRGVEELSNYKLSGEQNARLKKAIAIATINSLVGHINTNFEYLQESIDKNRWYINGETNIREAIKSLELLGQDTGKFSAKLSAMKENYESVKIAAETADKNRYFTIEKKSYSKSDNYEIGEILQCYDGRIGKVVSTRKYYQDDGMSFGFMEDELWVKSAKCDTAAVTESEKAKFIAEREAEKAAREVEEAKEAEKAEFDKTVREFVKYVSDNGVYPQAEQQISVTGETVYDDMNVYGGGCKILIVNDTIWAIKNNGMDGDYWGNNNIRTGGAGAIGHYMEIDDTCRTYVDKIKSYQK